MTVDGLDRSDLEHPCRWAATAPDRPAVIEAASGAVVTYADLDARANRLAHAFRSLGLGVGDHVAILMHNTPEYFEVVWAGLRSGLYVTPINWHLSTDEVEYVVADCGASAAPWS